MALVVSKVFQLKKSPVKTQQEKKKVGQEKQKKGKERK